MTLEVKGLSVTRGHRQVLSNIHFKASPGELFAIAGPNGAGKSSLLECIVGTLPCEGEVLVDGVSIRSLAPRERARRVAYVPQRSDLRSALCVRDVVALGRYAHGAGLFGRSKGDEEAVEEALRAMDLGAYAERSFTALSMGEAQRVLIARALATEAPIILLDEPTAALDIRQSLATLKLLRSLAKRGLTLVAVLHELSAIHEYADRALLLQDGHMAKVGAAMDVIAPEPIREVYGVDMTRGERWRFELASEPEDDA
jgi:iron complex transport system ATP-binding protein